MSLNPPSASEQQRACDFLMKKKNTQYLKIYQILIHSVNPLSASQIMNQMGINTSANNVASKLNWLRRCRLVTIAKAGASDLSDRQVYMWAVESEVPKQIVHVPAKSWFLVFRQGVFTALREASKKVTLGSVSAEFPGHEIIRVSES